jgi:hypothetical protein
MDRTENASSIIACSLVAGETKCPQSCSLVKAVVLSSVNIDFTCQWVYMSHYLLFVIIHLHFPFSHTTYQSPRFYPFVTCHVLIFNSLNQNGNYMQDVFQNLTEHFPTRCVYAFRKILKTNNDYLP